jgi:hypothetical protein
MHSFLSSRWLAWWSGSLFVLVLGERGEEGGPHHGDRLLESHFKAVVQGLRAHNSVLASIHHEAAQARVRWVRLVEFGKEPFRVDNDGARDVILSLEGHDLAEHGAFVLADGVVDDGLEDINIALAAPQGDLGLNQLNQTLDEQILEQITVSWTILSEALGHLLSRLGLQTLYELMCALHAIDTLLVLLFGFLNLEVALSDLQVLQHLILQTLLLGLNLFLRLGCEVGFHLGLDLFNTFDSLSADELDHAIHDQSWLLIVHFC